MIQGTAQRVDVVIVTAIPLEYAAVLKVDAGAVPGSEWREDRQANGVAMAYRAFEVPKGRPLQVAVAVAPDMATAAALATLIPLIEKLEPRCIAMCGVCAGRPGKVQLGDVIAAERLYYHDTGKQTREEGKPEKLEQDLRTFNLRPDWKVALERMNAADHFRGQDWLETRPMTTEWRVRRALWAIERGAPEPRREVPFKLHAAPMASGNKVIEDEKIWDRLAAYERETLGLDMEAAAVGAVAHYLHHKRLDAIVMKGVMDFANVGRDDHFKEFAARASAECLIWFLRDHVETPSSAGFDDVLSPGTWKLPQGDAPPSKLLQARFGVVPWHDAGRAELLAELDAWADDVSLPVAAWLLQAEGGVGKTRLAIEWVRRRRERHDIAGFLELRPPSDWLDQLIGHRRPVIMAIDDAESRGDLADRLREVAQLAGSKHRVRVLLLARNDGDWWQSLLTQAPELEPMLTHKPPRRLAPLASKAPDRQKVLEAAVRAFAKHWKLASTPVPNIDLADPLYARVLYLHLAALLAVEAARQASPIRGAPAKLESSAVLPAVLDHEERAWRDPSAKPTDWEGTRKLARQLMVAATLRGGLHDEEEARRVVARLQRREPTDSEEQVLVALRRLYQHPDPNASYLPALEPDLLGEGMVLRLVQERATINEDDWIELTVAADGSELTITTAFTVLGRTSVADRAGARPWITRLLRKDLSQRATLALRAAKVVGTSTVHAVVGDVLAEELEHAGTLAIARAYEKEGIPRPAVSLARVAEWQSRTMLEGASAAGSDDATTLADGARWLSQHGADLSALGQREAALATTQEAVSLYRALAEQSPEAFRPALAGSLNSLGRMQRAMKQHNAALTTTEEAVGIYRALAEQSPEAFLPALASSLNNLGNRLCALGWETALATTLEAVRLYRALADRSPEVFLPALTTSLSNLGKMQRAMEQHEAALATTLEAVRLYRALADRNPEAFLPDLAGNLTNLGRLLQQLGRGAEGDAAMREAEALKARVEELQRS